MRRIWKSLAYGVAALVLLAGLGLALSWAPDRPVDSLKSRWAAPASGSKFVDVRGMSVHYRDEGPRGDAQPVVLLHGTSASLHTWDGWVAELAQTRRVIRFDLPGFGLTGPYAGQWLNEDGGRYTALNYAKFVVATLDAVRSKLDQPIPLGYCNVGTVRAAGKGVATVPVTPWLGHTVLGKTDAPVEIVEYASTTCSHCQAFHQQEFPKLKSALERRSVSSASAAWS